MAKEETQSEPPRQVIEGETVSKTELIFEEHRKTILAGAVVLVVVVFGFIFVNHRGKAKQEEAALAFSKASTLADYAAVSSTHAGTVAAGNALLMKADLESKEGKIAEAKATLERFIADYPDHPFHLQGVLALGAHEEAGGNLDEAQKHYQQVIDAEAAPEFAPLALIRKGDVLYARGDYEGARSVYQSVTPAYPGTPFSYKVQEKLNREKLRDLPAPPPEVATPPVAVPQDGAGTPISIPVQPAPTPGTTTPVPVPVPVPVAVPAPAPAPAAVPVTTPTPAPAPVPAPAPETTTPAPAPAPETATPVPTATTQPVPIPAAPAPAALEAPVKEEPKPAEGTQ